MKTLKSIVALLLLTVGFGQAQDITVQGEKKLNADFKKYKTYDWMKTEKKNPQIVEYIYEEKVPNSNKRNRKGKDEYVIYSYAFFVPSEDPAIDASAKAAVESELDGRGYKKSPTPDLLVSYRILDNRGQVKGYNAPPTKASNGTEVHQPADTVTYAVKGGTVMVSLVDAKTDEVVWEGFASGVARNNGTLNDKTRIKEAVNLIFSKYEFRADKYGAGN